MDYNYHTHTYRCGHADDSMKDEDYVKDFINKGFKSDFFLHFISKISIYDVFRKCKTKQSSISKIISRLNLFEDMGFDYYGPINGNNINACIRALKRIKDNKGPVMVHILTQKGKGYALSEQDESGNYHGVAPFNVKTGKPLLEKKEKSLK